MTDQRIPKHCTKCDAVFVALFDVDLCQDCSNESKEQANAKPSKNPK